MKTEVKERIEKRIAELKSHQQRLENELFAVRAVVGELEIILDPSRLEQLKELEEGPSQE